MEIAGNLSAAWAAALLHLMARGVERIEPLVVSVTEFGSEGRPLELAGVSTALDETLRQHDMNASIHTVANTIFPDRWWHPEFPREQLYVKYLRLLPRLKRDRRNQYGMYFERLIRFNGDSDHSNQLEYVLGSFAAGRHAASSLQVAVFDPSRDLTRAARRGFPCLQHLVFAPDVPAGRLRVTAFYATQYVFERAYGNYLGLCLLGRFMAHEMGLRLACMTCIATQAKLSGDASKSSLRDLETDVRASLQPGHNYHGGTSQ